MTQHGPVKAVCRCDGSNRDDGFCALIACGKLGANVLEFVLTVLLLELTPGPNMAYLAALTLDRGRRAGLLATAGVAVGLSVHALVAALGLGVVISKVPIIYDLFRWTGVAYILFMAWEAWQADNGRPGLTGSASSPLFWRGFLSNVFNPKSIIFFVSVIPGFVRHGSGGPGLLLEIARLGAIYVAIATAIHAGIVLLAGHLRPFLVSGGRQRLIRRTLALALVLVAAWLAWTTRRT